MKERQSRVVKIACAAIVAWIVIVAALVLTVPFRQPAPAVAQGEKP